MLKMSLDDARGLLGASDDATAVVAQIRDEWPATSAGTGWLVLTDGDRGCWYGSRSHGPVGHLPAFKVAALEPTGAGDAFTAALLSRLLRRRWQSLEEADVRYAAAAGALATTRPGALDGLPTATELGRFLSVH